MTNPQKPITVEAGDLRRAAALTVHYGRSNDDGVKAVFAETAEAQRVMQLILAMLQMNDEIVPLLYTPDGLAILSRHVLRLAGMEQEGDA